MKGEYKKEIEETILNEIERHNQYLKIQIDQITETNEQIEEKITTEFLSLKFINNKYYEPICVDSELNTGFNTVELDARFKDMIKTISFEINESYQPLFLKEKSNQIVFDYDILERIVSIWFLSCYKYIRLLNQFKDQKQGLRPLTKYKNALNTILMGTHSEKIKMVLQQEYNFYENIDSKYLVRDGELFEIITRHNTSESIRIRSKIVGIPKYKLSKAKCNYLEKYIKKQINNLLS